MQKEKPKYCYILYDNVVEGTYNFIYKIFMA